MKNLGAQVRLLDTTDIRDRVVVVYRVLKHDVRVTGLKLDLCNGLEELTSRNLRLSNALVLYEGAVVVSHREVGEVHTVVLFDIIRREQVHIFARLKKLKGNIRNDQAKAQGLNADLLVSVLSLGIQELHDVWMVDIEINRSGPLTLTKLICVRESVL